MLAIVLLELAKNSSSSPIKRKIRKDAAVVEDDLVSINIFSIKRNSLVNATCLARWPALTDKYFWIDNEQCIPTFLASVTLECYDKSKREGGQQGTSSTMHGEHIYLHCSTYLLIETALFSSGQTIKFKFVFVRRQIAKYNLKTA